MTVSTLALQRERVGLSCVSYPRLDVESALAQVAALGFRRTDLGALPGWCDHVGLDRGGESDRDSDPDYGAWLVCVVRKHGQRIVSLNADLEFGADSRRGYRRAKKVIQVAALLGAGNITLSPGRGESVDSRLEDLVALLDWMLWEVGNLPLTVSLEVPHARTRAGSYASAMALMRSLSSLRIGMTVDTAHLSVCGTRWMELLASHADRIVHVHLRDWADGRDVEPGSGNFDFPTFFDLLRDVGYKGTYMLELKARPMAKPQSIALQARQALEYLTAVSP